MRKLLLGGTADVNHGETDGCTPAYAATEGGHVNCLKLLAEHGADLNKGTDVNWAPHFTWLASKEESTALHSC